MQTEHIFLTGSEEFLIGLANLQYSSEDLQRTFSKLQMYVNKTRRLHGRSLRLPTRRKWAQSGYLCTTPSTAQAGADAGFSWS